jgi:hypothetical protein
MNLKGKYVLNEVNSQIILTRNNVAFCLMTMGGQQLEIGITEASILIRKLKLSPSILLAHATTLESGTAKYPTPRVICRSFTAPTGYLEVSYEKLFSGSYP